MSSAIWDLQVQSGLVSCETNSGALCVGMIDDGETKRVLQKSGLFQNLDGALLNQVLKQISCETWAHKRTVPAQNISDRLHVIIAGRMKITQVNPDTGRMVTLFLLAPGDAFDMLQLLTGRPCDGIVQARDDLDLLTMPMEEMRKLITAHPEINRSFLPYLGKQMRNLADLAGDLALHDTETRLAHLIMRHIDNKDPSHRHLSLINDLSHEMLAEMIGSVRAVVNRQLQHWRKQGIISLDHGHIHIEKLHALLDRAKAHALPPSDDKI